jgi:hypothetical protein
VGGQAAEHEARELQREVRPRARWPRHAPIYLGS